MGKTDIKLLMAVVFFASSATATESVLADISVGVGVLHEYFNYQELDEQGEYLDGEFGFMNGVGLTLEKKFNEIETRLSLERSVGSVRYVGQLGGGALYITETDEEIDNISIEGKFRPKVGEHLKPSILIGLGSRVWRRDIKPKGGVRGLYEVYRWQYGMLGLAAEVRASARWTFGVEGQWFRQINPKIDVDLGAGYDEVTLDLGSKNNFRISSLTKYEYSDSLAIEMELYLQTWHIGRSDSGVITGTGSRAGSSVVEPESETYVTGVHFSAIF